MEIAHGPGSQLTRRIWERTTVDVKCDGFSAAGESDFAAIYGVKKGNEWVVNQNRAVSFQAHSG
jgi:hypothetical protein